MNLQPLVESLLNHDPYFLLADYQSYLDCQQQVDRVFRDQTLWTRRSILNVARSGIFSSDRAIQEYCDHIWKIQPVKVEACPVLAVSSMGHSLGRVDKAA